MKEETTREKSLDWYYQKSRDEQIDLKNKYFAGEPIDFSDQWGFHFTFGQIEDMFKRETNLT